MDVATRPHVDLSNDPYRPIPIQSLAYFILNIRRFNRESVRTGWTNRSFCYSFDSQCRLSLLVLNDLLWNMALVKVSSVI